MTITVAFIVVVATILVAGQAFRRFDVAHHVRFGDEAGSARATPALARVEAVRLTRHPTWIITVVLITALTGVLVATEQDATVEADGVEFFMFLGLPLGGLALIVAAHRNATRSRRDHTDELFAATPTSPRARTSGFLLACLGPIPVAVVYLLALLVVRELLYESPLPDSGGVVLELGLVLLLVVVGGGVVGVFLSRWLPVTAAALVGMVAVIWLNNGVQHHDPRFRWLRVAVEENLGGRFDITPALAWRVLFLAGLVGLGACLALWRHPARPVLFVATGAAITLIATSGWVMSRPVSDDQVARVVDELENPTDHQVCRSLNDVRYCAYPETEPWIDVWAPAVSGVLARVPTEHRPTDVRVVQRSTIPFLAAPTTYNGGTSYPFLDEVVADLDPAVAWAEDDDLHPAIQMNDDQPDIEVAFQAASRAVGLPTSVSWDHPIACGAVGQARLLLAGWLAAGATATTERSLRSAAERVENESLGFAAVPLDTVYDYESDSVGSGSFPVVGATGSGADLLAVRSMLDADQDRIGSVVDQHWDELVLAGTPATRLLELAGVDPAIEPVPMNVGRACP